MTISLTLLEYLEWAGVDYEVIPHKYTENSLQTAKTAHVPANKLAKCVLLEDENDYLMAVLPADHRIKLSSLHRQLNRNLELASESEVAYLFSDCDIGAIPPIGQAYGYEVIVDDSLTGCDDIYFEAGDHRDLVHLSGRDFREIMGNARQGHFSQQA
ncbi:MAG: YbaK/EbsC family protein [Gammaproteobacteria bacterium]|nr:YbaK/EbsC family protein [Gammaproteobacteria bacterium]